MKPDIRSIKEYTVMQFTFVKIVNLKQQVYILTN